VDAQANDRCELACRNPGARLSTSAHTQDRTHSNRYNNWSVELYTTINDKNLAGEAFGATELTALISDVLARSAVPENRPLTHRFDSFGHCR
jgi:hypothetical protein